MSFVRPLVTEKGSTRAACVGEGMLAHVRPASIAADAASTITAAMILGGVVIHSTHTAARIDTTDTAANILAAMPDMDTGDTFMLIVSSAAAFTITLAGGTGVTASGNLIVAANSSRMFVLTKTSATTMTLVGL